VILLGSGQVSEQLPCVRGPETVDQPLPRHDAIRVENKQREHASLLETTEGNRSSFSPRLERPEQPELDHGAFYRTAALGGVGSVVERRIRPHLR
jgi:hypothetical protein